MLTSTLQNEHIFNIPKVTNEDKNEKNENQEKKEDKNKQSLPNGEALGYCDLLL